MCGCWVLRTLRRWPAPVYQPRWQDRYTSPGSRQRFSTGPARYTGGVFSRYRKVIPAMASNGIPLLQGLLQHHVERREEQVIADMQHRRQRQVAPSFLHGDPVEREPGDHGMHDYPTEPYEEHPLEGACAHAVRILSAKRAAGSAYPGLNGVAASLIGEAGTAEALSHRERRGD